MVKRTGPSNAHMRKLITELKRTKSAAWKDVAEKLSAARRKRVEVNIGEINMYADKGETVVVPGVVLANGKLDKSMTIAAWRFSQAAVDKIRKAKGEAVAIEDMVKANPQGSKIRIMV